MAVTGINTLLVCPFPMTQQCFDTLDRKQGKLIECSDYMVISVCSVCGAAEVA